MGFEPIRNNASDFKSDVYTFFTKRALKTITKKKNYRNNFFFNLITTIRKK